MNVHFIGIHYKKGFVALDSDTLSGQVIDRIIEGLEISPLCCYKHNLFPGCEIPNDGEKRGKIAYQIVERDHIDVNNDIVVRLGNQVQKYWNRWIKNVIDLYHPAYPKSEGFRGRYIANAIKRINYLIASLEAEKIS